MDALTFGKAGLQGWRARLADVLAEPVARHSRLDADAVRAAVGAAFFLLSVAYVVGTIRRIASRT